MNKEKSRVAEILLGKASADIEGDAFPPAGYLWIWMGVLRRWHCNYFLLETPGVLTHSRNSTSQIKGAFCLRDARVIASNGNCRQFCIVSPAGIAYFRSVRKEQRGVWISSIRASIERYTQCIQQTMKASNEGDRSLRFCEPEQIKLAAEVKIRTQTLMAELEPHKMNLRNRLCQLTTRTMSVLESESEVDTSQTLSLNLNPLQRRESARSGKMSADDLLMSASGRLAAKNKESKRMTRSMTQRDSTSPTRAYLHHSERGSGASSEDSKITQLHSNKDTLISNGQPTLRTNEAPVPIGTDLWSSYHSFVHAVRTVLQKEAQETMELKAENQALKKLLLKRCARSGGGGDLPFKLASDSTSLSYSTTESDFNRTLLEDSDDDPESFGASTSLPSPTLEDIAEGEQRQEDFLDALEVVRRADYVTKNSSKSVALVVNLSKALRPKQDEEVSEEDPERPLENEDSCELSDDSKAVRPRLPMPQPIHRGFSTWAMLKHAIGRDLTRITLPATINEPLSALQRFVEDFEHASYLRKAAFCACSHERLLYITAFVLSSYNAGLLRDRKPFNPVLGETFEWSNDHFQFLGEQVSQNPPILCFNVKGFDVHGSGEMIYEVQGEFELRSKFWGTSINVFPTGRIELFLATTNERFVWNKACISIHNLVIGQLCLEFHGEVFIRNLQTGEHAKLRLAKARGCQIDRGNVEGRIFDKTGEELYSIEGNFTSSIYAKKRTTRVGCKTKPLVVSEKEIYRAVELPAAASEQYHMTPLAVSLNQLRTSQLNSLPKTDSRFRPDVRALENGEVHFATSEKLRLEEKQLQAKKARKENGQKYMPMWFTLRRSQNEKDHVRLVDSDAPLVWQFREEYWTQKANRAWTGCPEIY